MTTESDVRALKDWVETLAKAVEDLAEIVENVLNGATKSTDAEMVGRIRHTARQVRNLI
jgi:hypothetical protein